MKLAKIENNIIVDVIVSSIPKEGYEEYMEGSKIGDMKVGDLFMSPPEIEEVEDQTLGSLQPYQFWTMLDMEDGRRTFERYIEDIEDKLTRVLLQSKLATITRIEPDGDIATHLKASLDLSDEEFETMWKFGVSL